MYNREATHLTAVEEEGASSHPKPLGCDSTTGEVRTSQRSPEAPTQNTTVFGTMPSNIGAFKEMSKIQTTICFQNEIFTFWRHCVA